ncbi:MAG TPA: hypothetical protein VKV25_09790, partial [Acidimicrobiales bacterium]|nr:hypothetical protein [Acidimicrobiales bacterium]
MSKVWFCRNCGYEVPGRGRCHLCKRRLEESPLPELAAGDEDDEVGYRLQEWDDPTRGALIVGLIEAHILHRFEEDELVVAAEDEARTDDLVERITTEAALRAEEEAALEPPDEVTEQMQLLADAARRLLADPTDMQADADAMEASSVVFMADEWTVTDADTWAAIGRVTRRLLVVLGSDQALEDDIRMQAGILDKLLTPLLAPPVEVNGSGVSEDVESAPGSEAAPSEAVASGQAASGQAASGEAASVEAASEEPGSADEESAAADTGEAVDEDALDEAWDEQEGEAAGRRGGRRGRARLGLRRRRGRRDETEPAADETEPAADETEPAAGETEPAAGESESAVDESESAAEEAERAEPAAFVEAVGTGGEPAQLTLAGRDSEAEGGTPDEADEAGRATAAAASGQSVYELPEWMPEQRAQLSILLEEAGVTYGWEAGDLVVPTAEDSQVEELFSQVDGVADDEDEEARYRALENLFAAADRFVN